MNAKEAIDRSTSHNEIVTLDYDEEQRLTLLAECDDHVAGNGVEEFWADADDSDGTDGKMLWRVHMHTEGT